MRPTTADRKAVQRANLCHDCQTWIPGKRAKLDHHIRTTHPATWQRMEAVRAEMRGEPC